jgi:hypothetical protein
MLASHVGELLMFLGKRVWMIGTSILLLCMLGASSFWIYLNRVDSERILDIPFATVVNERGEEQTLALDVYLPDSSRPGPHPAILWFHGGGFRSMDKSQLYIKGLCDEFAKRGFVTVAPDDRLRRHPEQDMAGTIADAVSDGRSAVDWLFENADRFGIDDRSVAVGGGSAGGIPVANLVHGSRGGSPPPDFISSRGVAIRLSTTSERSMRSSVVFSRRRWQPAPNELRRFRSAPCKRLGLARGAATALNR